MIQMLWKVGLVLLGIVAGYFWLTYVSDKAVPRPELSQSSDRLSTEIVKTITPAVPFTLPDLSQNMRELSEWEGQLLVLNFWATWCPPCIKEIPAFVEWQAQYGERGLQFVGIAIDQEENVLDFVERLGINYPILMAGETGLSLAQDYGNRLKVLPFTVVISQQGNILLHHPGEFTAQDFNHYLLPLL
jgi:thiol-disulfide isomerase/thioredoxin